MADLAITSLPAASQLSSSDLLYVAIPNPLSPIGFSLCKMTSAQFGLFLNKQLLFASDLETDSKNIIGAINELKAGGGGGGASVIQLTQAEYTALTTAEKMNGSIYKLTDKAIFYCLDEEYHAVKELTTAQYEALTTAQQNNGTIYIQTDKETTGSDIAVSDSDATSIAEALARLKIEGGSVGADASNPKRVMFSNIYTSPPFVTITPLNTSSPRNYVRACTLTAVTTTYFEFVEVAVKDDGTFVSAGLDVCMWVAYGV